MDVALPFYRQRGGRARSPAAAQRALADAKRRKCSIVAAKLDRLSRDVEFISGLMSRRVPFIVAALGLVVWQLRKRMPESPRWLEACFLAEFHGASGADDHDLPELRHADELWRTGRGTYRYVAGR